MSGVRLLPAPTEPIAGWRSVIPRISRFPYMELAYMPWFYDSAGSMTSLTITRRPVLPSPPNHKVGNLIKVISELNCPACMPPVNASLPPSREANA